MEHLEARKKTAEWENVSEESLLMTCEDKESFHFLYKKNSEYFKVAIDKKTSDFYSMTDTITENQIKNYEDKIYSNLVP